MSLNGQCPTDRDDGSAVTVVTFPMPPGSVFDWHVHGEHQLAWAAQGVLTVRTATTAFVLPPTRALWIPAGVRHETLSTGTATMRSAYVRPDRCAIAWADCTPIEVAPLLGELIDYLEDESLDPARREHGEALLVDLVRPVAMTTIDVRMPAEDRASQVAGRLLAQPDDGRTLAQWGRAVGASERTLARIFFAETGVPFGRWRSLLRLQIAMTELAGGAAVSTVARQVGYESVSAFVAAFRRETGATPSAYFRAG